MAPSDLAYDVIVLGAGAAGLMCAVEAGKRGRRVVVLEQNAQAGEKIRISGGGRCNFTNVSVEPAHFLSENRHFCTSALARFTPRDFIALVERHKIPYHEKHSGQLFCDATSREILAMFRAECTSAGVEVRTGCRIEAVDREEGFLVRTAAGEFRSPSLVVATGGLSIPALGATDLGYRLARQFGLSVTEVRPGLVPLTFSGADGEMMQRLSGVSTAAVVGCGGRSFAEQLLFTHKGLSGPAILQISSYWRPGDAIEIDLLPAMEIARAAKGRSSSAGEMPAFLARHLPRRLAQEWCAGRPFAKPLSQASLQELAAYELELHHWVVRPDGTEGFGKAEVTCGGVDTGGLSSKTMEARTVKGLYFVGEVVDVTGHLGGYNFQWAWASGFAAGQVA